MLAETALVSLVLYLLLKFLVAVANGLLNNWSLLEIAEGSFKMLDKNSVQAQLSKQSKSTEEALISKCDSIVKKDEEF